MTQAITIFFALYFFSTTRAQLASAKVLINEVLAYPDDTVEAVELVYYSEDELISTVDLTDWTIWDRLGIIFTLNNQQLSQGEYLVITLLNKLRNTGDSVIIKDNQEVEQDSFTFTNSKKGVSYSRVSFDSNQFIETVSSIGKDNGISLEATITPTPTPTPAPTTNPPKEEVHTTAQETESTINNQQLEESAQQEQNNQPTALSNRPELIKQIFSLREEINQTYEKPLHIPPAISTKPFTTIVDYNTPIVSSMGVVSVIIGGLLFLIASKIIYE